jgi:hypothetical protein
MAEKKPPRQFNEKLLNTIILRDNALLVGTYTTLTRETNLTFKCECGIEYTKKFRCAVDFGGAHCNTCSQKKARDKYTQTNKDKYGVDHPAQNKNVQLKMKNTFKEKYGVSHPLKNIQVRNKMENTMIEKYGSKHALQVDSIKQKQKETNILKFGVENPFQSETIKEKIKEMNVERYGAENPFHDLAK